MHSLYHKDKIWIDHEKFIPERFDPQSKYALTPSGEKRPHYAFVPFLGGKRICLGKTFVEIISKISGPTILSHYDFEFTSESQIKNKLPNDLFVTCMPKEILKIKKY